MASGPGQRTSVASSLESEIILDEYGGGSQYGDGASTANDSPPRIFHVASSQANGHTHQDPAHLPIPNGPSVSVLSLSSADTNFVAVSKGYVAVVR